MQTFNSTYEAVNATLTNEITDEHLIILNQLLNYPIEVLEFAQNSTLENLRALIAASANEEDFIGLLNEAVNS